MKVLAWWMVGCGSCVAMTLPDYKNHNPYFTWRDPRTFYPPVGWSPYTQAPMDDALFAYQMSLGELIRRYPEKAQEMRDKLGRTILMPGPVNSRNDDDNHFLWVAEYYHEDLWMVATLGADATSQTVELIRSEKGQPGHPGIQPAVAFSLFTPGGAKGRSIFADQVSIQAAMARMFSQRLDFFDRTLYPLIFHTPLTGKTIKIGPMATNEFDTTSGQPPRVDVVAPAHPMDVDQTMQFTLGLSRMLNRNPEQEQGAGQANSSKAIEALKAGINDTVREGIWPPFLEGLPSLYEKAATMDRTLWGGETKEATGKRRNANFRVSYSPDRDLANRESDWEVQPGVGLAGYQGTLEIMQLVGAELMSEEDALEQGDWATEPQAAKRRIQRDRMEKLIWQDLAGKAQSGILMPGAFDEIDHLVQTGTDLFAAIAALEKAGKLYQQPPAPPGGPDPNNPLAALAGGGPGGPAGPGAPGPGQAPPASFLPPPTLQALRGGPGPLPAQR